MNPAFVLETKKTIESSCEEFAFCPRTHLFSPTTKEESTFNGTNTILVGDFVFRDGFCSANQLILTQQQVM